MNQNECLVLEPLEPRILLSGWGEPGGPMMRSDALVRPPESFETSSDSFSSPPAGQRPYGANYHDNSEYMIGDVYVTVVLLESDGSIDAETEDWSAGRINNVKSEIQEGLTWWETTFAGQGSDHWLDFTIDWTYADAPLNTGYEPITRSSSDDWLWVNDFLSAAGYATGSNRYDTLNKLDSFNDGQRVNQHTEWAYTIFVADSLNDSNNMFTDSYFAYAWLGGPYTQMTYGNNGWGIGNMGQVLAHETGHIFFALDEYPGSGYYTDRSGYYNTQNLNAYDGHPNPGSRVASLMAESSLQNTAYANYTSSPTSLEMIGWKDSDGDDLFDVLDVAFSLTGSGSYNDGTGLYRFQGNSSVQTLNNQNPNGYQHDITINTIDVLQYRPDGGGWLDVQSYDAYSVSIDEQVGPFSPGFHSIDFRTFDVQTGVASTLFSDTFTVSGADTEGPRVTAQNPSGTVPAPQSSLQFDFNEPMNTASFAPADDVVGFTGPGGDLTAQITGFSWLDSDSLRITFNAQSTPGAYQMIIGPDIEDLTGNPMNQNGNGTNGEIPGDRYTGNFTTILVDVQGPRITSHSPAGTVSAPQSAWQFNFNEAMDTNSFSITSDVVSFTGPGGNLSGQIAGFSWLDSDSLEITFTAQSVPGAYQIIIVPNILDQAGNPMDQNNNGTNGEIPGDRYMAIFTIPDTQGPRVTGHSPSGAEIPPQAVLQFDFDEAMNTGSFSTASDMVSFTGPSGDLTGQITGFSWLDSDSLRITFNAQSTPGAYQMIIGPNILDLSANPMNQNGNGTNGEIPGDRYTAGFSIVDLPPSINVNLQTASDSGLSNTDNLTNDATPSYNVTVNRNGTIFLDFDDDGLADPEDVTFVAGSVGTYVLTAAGPLPDGDYPVRATFTVSGHSPASDTDPTTIDTVLPGQPAAADLQAVADTGVLDFDDVTADNTPTFDVVAAPYFRFYRNANLISGEYETGNTFTPGAQSDGTYDYTVASVDAAGNVSTPSGPLTVTIDTQAPTTPPIVDLTALSDTGRFDSDNVTRDTTPTFAVSAGPYFRFYRNSNRISDDYVSGSLYTAPIQPDGEFSYTITSVDAAGNESSAGAAMTVKIDTQTPNPPTQPDLATTDDTGMSPSDNVTSVNTPRFSGEQDADVDVVRLYVDGVETGSRIIGGADYEIVSSLLADGENRQAAVRAEDLAGNQSGDSDALTITIDTVSPDIPSPPDLQATSDTGWADDDNITRDNTPTFDVAGGPFFRFYRDGGQVGGDYETGDSYLLDVQPDDTYAYAVSAVDAAGNVSGPGDSLTVVIDTQAPNPLLTAPDLIPSSDTGISDSDNITADNTPTFVGSPDADVDIIRLWVDGDEVGSQIIDEDDFTITTLLLADGVDRQVTVFAEDLAGNPSNNSDALLVTIDTTPPDPPPAPDLRADSDTGASATDNITNDTTPTLDLSGLGPYYRLERDSLQISGNYADQTPYTDEPLADGEHGYVLFAVDAAGNVSEESPELEITIDTVPPAVQAVTPSEGTLVDQTLTEIQITFTDAVGLDVSEALTAANYSLTGHYEGNVTIKNIADWGADTFQLTFNTPWPDGHLPLDVYTFTASGASSIRDLAGNPLDGNGDGIGGEDYVHVFSLVHLVNQYVSGDARVTIYDVAGDVDVDIADIKVKFKKDGSVSYVSLSGSGAMEGVGMVFKGTPSVGTIKDKRKDQPGDLAFIASDAPVKTIKLKSGMSGFPLNGRELGGMTFDTDLDKDGDTTDATAIYTPANVKTVKLFGDVEGDLVIGGTLSKLIVKDGDFRADLRVEGIDSRGVSMKNLSVAQTVSNATVTTAGSVNNIKAGQFVNTGFFVGFTPDDPDNPLAGGTFTNTSILKSVKAVGIKGSSETALIDSFFSAAQIGRGKFKSIQTDNAENGHRRFGILARDSIKAVAANEPGWKWDKSGPADQGVDDFHVLLI